MGIFGKKMNKNENERLRELFQRLDPSCSDCNLFPNKCSGGKKNWTKCDDFKPKLCEK